MASADLFFFLKQNSTEPRDIETDLFDAVGVDGGLRLQDADRLCLLGALRHLPHLLSDEVVDAVQRLHRALDQTHPLCRPCKHTNADRRVRTRVQARSTRFLSAADMKVLKQVTLANQRMILLLIIGVAD